MSRGSGVAAIAAVERRGWACRAADRRRGFHGSMAELWVGADQRAVGLGRGFDLPRTQQFGDYTPFS